MLWVVSINNAQGSIDVKNEKTHNLQFKSLILASKLTQGVHFSEPRQIWSILLKNVKVVDFENYMRENRGEFGNDEILVLLLM